LSIIEQIRSFVDQYFNFIIIDHQNVVNSVCIPNKINLIKQPPCIKINILNDSDCVIILELSVTASSIEQIYY